MDFICYKTKMIPNQLFSLAACLLLLVACSDQDPYLNLDEQLRIETRSLVVPDDYALLADQSILWGVPFEMTNIDFIEAGNVAEVAVSFIGGCGLHRFALYANDTYESQASFDQPLDVTLYLYQSEQDETCADFQTYVLRQIDLSFLHPGRYNLTIENASDRISFSVMDYEIK